MTFLLMSSTTCCRHGTRALISIWSANVHRVVIVIHNVTWLLHLESQSSGDRDTEMMEWWCVRWEWPLKFVLCLLFDLDPDILCGQSAAAVITVTWCYKWAKVTVVTKPESCNQSQESSEQCTGLDFYNSEGLRQEFGSARSEPIVVTIGG